MDGLPPLFLERFKNIIPPEYLESSLKSFSQKKALSARVNTLKAGIDEAQAILKNQGIDFETVSWFDAALTFKSVSPKALDEIGLTSKGLIYIQSLSSMIPALVLNPQKDDCVLDMCAAPGSKTTQMAAHINKEGRILAVESVKDRFYKLKSVVALLGATNVDVKFSDARRLKTTELFDKILLDAQCTSEGRFLTSDPKTFSYWSPRKIKEMRQKQRGLLLAASRLLKVGGTLVYSTCTFSPEENEESVDWLLKKTKGMMSVKRIDFSGIRCYPAVLSWGKKTFDKTISGVLRVLPDEKMEGFFVAKILKGGGADSLPSSS